MERANLSKGWWGEEGVRSKKKIKKGMREEGCWTSEEGSSCGGGFKEDLVFTAAHCACNRYKAAIKGGICHRKICFSSIEE